MAAGQVALAQLRAVAVLQGEACRKLRLRLAADATVSHWCSTTAAAAPR